MGFQIRWDKLDIERQINRMAGEINSPYNDGFTGFYTKQDMYRMKWLIEDALNRCPTFAGEDEWLREQEKKKVIKILSDK